MPSKFEFKTPGVSWVDSITSAQPVDAVLRKLRNDLSYIESNGLKFDTYGKKSCSISKRAIARSRYLNLYVGNKKVQPIEKMAIRIPDDAETVKSALKEVITAIEKTGNFDAFGTYTPPKTKK